MPWAPLTSFVGREREAAELAGLVREHRLVTVTGPGGVGKTRLAAEVARAAAGQFPDGVLLRRAWERCLTRRGCRSGWRRRLGVRQVRGRSAREVVAGLLAPRRLLLVLDNCEHVLDAAAELCGELLKVADDVRLLATSREQLWVGGEARYRLSPLELPGSDDPAEIGRSAAVTLFTERAQRSRPAASPSARRTRRWWRGWWRGWTGCRWRSSWRRRGWRRSGWPGWLTALTTRCGCWSGKDSLAAGRHRSLAAVADWSYQLLSAAEQRVFRRLAVFPGPFTLEARRGGGGPEAGPVVLRLVDCSLVAPPRPGPDQRMRYAMLQTLRAYGLARLAEAGRRAGADGGAGRVRAVRGGAGRGRAGGNQDRELAALRWLDAEDATLGRALGWALEHDPDAALALATALAPWWLLRGRMAEGYAQLAAAPPGPPRPAGAGLRAGLAGVPVQLRGQPRQQPGPLHRGLRGRRGARHRRRRCTPWLAGP